MTEHVRNKPVLMIDGARRPDDCIKLVSESSRDVTKLSSVSRKVVHEANDY